jgi:hypothetical protein
MSECDVLKSCGSCQHELLDADIWPCRSCWNGNEYSAWTPDRKTSEKLAAKPVNPLPEERSVNKSCQSCRYRDAYGNDSPCVECCDYDRWFPDGVTETRMGETRLKAIEAEGAVRYDNGKEKFGLIPPGPLFEVARVYTEGARKYASRNWEKGMDWSRVFDASMRHMWKFWNGEENDHEDGLPHLAHAAWGMLTLLQYVQSFPELDDRSKLKYDLEANDVNKRGTVH